MRVPLPLIAALLIVAGSATAQPAGSCCTISAIEAATGVVTAKVTATGNVFQFKVADAGVLKSLKAGQAVYANFTAKQVSLDGKTACCSITSGPSAPAGIPAPTRAPAALPNAPAPSPAAAPVGAAAVSKAQLTQWVLPTVSYGAAQPVTLATGRPTTLGRMQSRQVTSMVAGKRTTATVLHLQGLHAVEDAPLSDGAKRLLEMHIRTIPPGESDQYIVNPQLAEEWVKAHPVPDYVKPPAPEGHKCGHWYDSFDCAGQAVTDEWRRNWEQATREWDHVSGELNKDWHMAEGCFADHTLSLPDIPVQFDIAPTMTVNMETSGSKDLGGGSASGKLQGSVGLGFPTQSDFKATLELFYLPCLPFVVRPRSLGAAGTMTVGERLKVDVQATGEFDKVFTIPPTGGPRIPIEVIPIVIAGVPVAEMDVSAYIEGDVEVGGKGSAHGTLVLDDPHKAVFDAACSGHGCDWKSHTVPVPATATETAQLQGTVFVKPSIYTALQLDFDVEALSARIGPQPFLYGSGAGCAYGTARQATNGASSSAENHALTADLDWGVDLRAEALVARKVVAGKTITVVSHDHNHLWFRDLAPGGSNALMAAVDATAQATAGKTATFRVKMPTCYPYTDKIHYEVSWTGAATPAPNPACQWQSGAGTCTFDPTKELALGLTWPASGANTLTVVATTDDHHRKFDPAPKPTQFNVSVGAGGGAP